MYQFLMAKKLLMNIVPLKWKLKKKEFKNKFQQNYLEIWRKKYCNLCDFYLGFYLSDLIFCV